MKNARVGDVGPTGRCLQLGSVRSNYGGLDGSVPLLYQRRDR